MRSKRKKIDYEKLTKEFIKQESIILTNDKRAIQSNQKTTKTYKYIISILIEYVIKYKINITKLDKYLVEKIFRDIQGKGYICDKKGNRKVYSKSTMRLLKIVGRKFFEFLKQEKLVNRNSQNPFDGKFHNFKDETNKNEKAIIDKYLTEDEIERVLTHIKDNIDIDTKQKGRNKETYSVLYEACLLMLCFGLRLSEVCNLDKKDFHINGNRLIKLHIKPSKRCKERDTYFIFDTDKRKEVVRIINNSNFKYKYNTIQTQLNRISKELNIEQLSAHSFRHSFGTYGVNKGISFEVISQMMGHNDIQTTKIYAKLLGVGIENNLLAVLG